MSKEGSEEERKRCARVHQIICVERAWRVGWSDMDGYSTEKRPLADSLAKIQCSIGANSAWSASSQNEYRKLYERASMNTRICSRNINRAIKSIPRCVYINKYRDSCRSLLTKAGSINLAGRKANSEMVISRTKRLLLRHERSSCVEGSFYRGFYRASCRRGHDPVVVD